MDTEVNEGKSIKKNHFAFATSLKSLIELIPMDRKKEEEEEERTSLLSLITNRDLMKGTKQESNTAVYNSKCGKCGLTDEAYKMNGLITH